MAGSLLDNISSFAEQPNLERVISSCTSACIHDEIAQMPMGYHTLVGSMGASLSSGQKQRLLLARALYKLQAAPAAHPRRSDQPCGCQAREPDPRGGEGDAHHPHHRGPPLRGHPSRATHDRAGERAVAKDLSSVIVPVTDAVAVAVNDGTAPASAVPKVLSLR
jgi:hypothetical protein